MGLRLVKDIYSSPAVELPLDGSTAIAINSLVFRDTTNGVVKSATAALGTTLNLVGIAAKPEVSGALMADIIPLVSNPSQLWEVDCTNNTAANQLLKAQAMTNATTVANTSTHTATTLGVFIPVALSGAATDKKLIGYFVTVGQVTA